MKIVKRVKQPSRSVSLKVKILSGICIAALLYSTAAQAMPGTGALNGEDARDVHPVHTDNVSK